MFVSLVLVTKLEDFSQQTLQPCFSVALTVKGNAEIVNLEPCQTSTMEIFWKNSKNYFHVNRTAAPGSNALFVDFQLVLSVLPKILQT